MKVNDATTLIRDGIPVKIKNTNWTDLGCGGGTFTNALANLLGDGGKIFAIDKQSQEINIDSLRPIKIQFMKLDFINDPLHFFNLDGILMANSLHYVKEKPLFIEKIKKHLKTNGELIIVEYDTVKQNRWVPYPISFDNLLETFSSAGFNHIKKIGERSSVYRSEKMYAASIRYY
jgi:ubiquinone/menaquinone biosynthesis C-methylase UbiE